MRKTTPKIIAHYKTRIEVPSQVTIGDYRERVEDLRGIGYPQPDGDFKYIDFELVVEAEDCFELGIAFADMALELDGLLGPYGWTTPRRDDWEHVPEGGA